MKGCWKPRRLLKGSVHRLLAGTHSKLWLTECSLGDAETEFCDFRVRDSGAATIVPSHMQGVGQFHLSCVEPSLPYGQIEICTNLVKSTCSTLVTTRGSQWLNFTGSWQAVSDLWVPWAFCGAAPGRVWWQLVLVPKVAAPCVFTSNIGSALSWVIL